MPQPNMETDKRRREGLGKSRGYKTKGSRYSGRLDLVTNHQRRETFKWGLDLYSACDISILDIYHDFEEQLYHTRVRQKTIQYTIIYV